MCALGTGLGDGCHGLKGVEGVQDFGEDLGEDYHLGEEETTALVFGAFFAVGSVEFGVRKIVRGERLDGPIGGENM